MLDVNVIVAAVLSPGGTPARLLRMWERGDFELIVSSSLIRELERTLAYPKLARRIPPDEARELVDWLNETATMTPDPDGPPPVSSSDPDDDYLIALAASASAHLVSGDGHLLDLAPDIPVVAPASFLDLVEADPSIEN